MQVQGVISTLRIFQEEGRTNLTLAMSKVMLYLTYLLFPLFIFLLLRSRLLPWQAALCGFGTAVLMRLFQVQSLVSIDELLARLFPTLRGAVRLGRVRIYEFRLKTQDNTALACILKGDLVGAGPIVGDRLRLRGRLDRGTFRVAVGINEETDNEIRPVRDPSPLILLASTLIFLGMAIFAALELAAWYREIMSSLAAHISPLEVGSGFHWLSSSGGHRFAAQIYYNFQYG
jgi:hypothetical protein